MKIYFRQKPYLMAMNKCFNSHSIKTEMRSNHLKIKNQFNKTAKLLSKMNEMDGILLDTNVVLLVPVLREYELN